MAVYSKEEINRKLKWVFTLPLTYVVYFAVSLLIPQAGFLSLILRYCVLLCTFVLICRFLPGLEILSLAFSRQNLGRLFSGAALMAVFLCAGMFIHMAVDPSDFSFTFNASLVLQWIPTVVVVILAALSEELMFRAFFAVIPAKRWKVCLASAFVFTLAHFSNPEISAHALASMAFYFVFGAFLMYFCLATGGIEFSLGVHVANNLVAALIFTYPDAALPTNALFTSPFSVVEGLAAVVCVYLSAFAHPQTDL